MTLDSRRSQRSVAMRALRRTRRYLCRNFVVLLVFVLFSAEMLYIHLNSSRITLTDMDAHEFCAKLRMGASFPFLSGNNEHPVNRSNETVFTSAIPIYGKHLSTAIHNQQSNDTPLQSAHAHADDVIAEWQQSSEFKECRKVAGIQRPYRSHLSIGIPTVGRAGHSYLTETLNSIIENTSDDEKSQTVVVVFLADNNYDFRVNTVQMIASTYMPHIESGFIQIVEPPFMAYPTFEVKERNYNDTEERVKWRSKQVVDFAYLFMYCKDLSRYYLNLEDDVITKPDFIPSINSFIGQQTQKWIVLEFSTLGFIGKLIKAEDLEQFARFLMLFYSEQPVDYLLRYFHSIHLQDKQILRKPTLFQHIGEHSSLANKIQKLKDPNFVQHVSMVTHTHEYKGDNPAADIITSMPQFENYKPENAYLPSSNSVFWSSRAGRDGDYFIVQFKDSATLNKVVIETGVASHANDTIDSGTLYASQNAFDPLQEGPDAQNMTGNPMSLVPIAHFVNGRVEVNGLDSSLNYPVKHLCITISKNQTTWVLIREIAVFTIPKLVT